MDLIAALQIALAQLVGPSAIFYALLAIGLNLHFGYAGLLNFGQIGFPAINTNNSNLIMPYGGSQWNYGMNQRIGPAIRAGDARAEREHRQADAALEERALALVRGVGELNRRGGRTVVGDEQHQSV